MTVHIGSSKKLLIDDWIIEKMWGVERRINPPTRYLGNPVIKADSPWERNILPMGTVLYDQKEKTFKVWYHCSGSKGCHIAYATSGDGLNWSKPHLGLCECEGSKENNLISLGGRLRPACCPTVTDLSEKPVFGQRYMMYCWVWSTIPEGGMRLAYSSNGVEWDLVPTEPFLTYGKFTSGKSSNDVVYGYCDGITGRFSMYHVVLLPNWSGCEGRVEYDFHPDWKRVVARRTSENGLCWSDPEVILMPDKEDPFDLQFYNLSVYTYEGVYVGAVSAYHVRKQTMDVQLVFSRDGKDWVRVGNREPFIPLGPEGTFDSHMITTFSHLVKVDDELWMYYVGSDTPHNVMPWNMAIGLAKLRLDGFVSLDAGSQGGIVVTKPLTFKGRHLWVNTNASSGTLLAEILDEYGTPLPGFTKEECEPVTADSVNHCVRWKHCSDVSSLEGKVVRLKFFLNNVKLYAFKFE